MAKKRVVIVGGGFGGVKAALALSDDENIDITLISDQTHFRYYPTLYHTATGGRSRNVSIPLEEIVDVMKVRLVKAEVTGIDRKKKVITDQAGISYPYDYVILALGVVTNYFGIKGLEEYSFSIKSLEEAERFKKHLHDQLTDENKPDLNYVIVGAGPTGIELAGALPAYLRHILEAHDIRRKAIHIDLIEAAPRLLPRMPKDTSRLVKRQLKRLGVKLYLNQSVQGETADELLVNGKPIQSHTVVWTAGVTNHPFFKNNGFSLTGHGKVAVNAYLEAEDGVYVIGDNANTPYSGMAQTALYDGVFVADNISRLVRGKDQKSYRVKKPVTVIPVGHHWAAVVFGKLHLYGRLGYMLRQASDFVAFHDYEPWWKATQQWLTEFGSEESCTACAIHSNRTT